MRAYELIKETFFRRTYIWGIHLVWLALYGIYWWLFFPDLPVLGRFVLVWGGFLLALALSAGIFGDDIASGRIGVLVTKPFWSGQLYIYRMLGLSLQGAVHFLLTGCLLIILQHLTRRPNMNGLALWLLASWLLFNTCAALSTSLSVVVARAFNSLLLLIVTLTGYVIITLLMSELQGQSEPSMLQKFIQYACPPFELLQKFAGGEHGQYSLTFGRFSITKTAACVVHSLMLTIAYSTIGIILLCRRDFSGARD
jgi:ABC-type transport system involved in multi-copper enzyme maturation permease subunit